jgi:hypothetical protein
MDELYDMCEQTVNKHCVYKNVWKNEAVHEKLNRHDGSGSEPSHASLVLEQTVYPGLLDKFVQARNVMEAKQATSRKVNYRSLPTTIKVTCFNVLDSTNGVAVKEMVQQAEQQARVPADLNCLTSVSSQPLDTTQIPCVETSNINVPNIRCWRNHLQMHMKRVDFIVDMSGENDDPNLHKLLLPLMCAGVGSNALVKIGTITQSGAGMLHVMAAYFERTTLYHFPSNDTCYVYAFSLRKKPSASVLKSVTDFCESADGEQCPFGALYHGGEVYQKTLETVVAFCTQIQEFRLTFYRGLCAENQINRQ